MLTLGIETSCDETAAAVVEQGNLIRANVIASQQALHAAYGGVVPELACRSHIEKIRPVIDLALQQAGATLRDIDILAVTQGPGLIGALLIGVSLAKALAYGLGKPLVAVHHLEGHISSLYLEHPTLPHPFVVLVVSGGHTELYYCSQRGRYRLLGHTRDDAVGECFDKVAKMLHLGYPGGPVIDRLASHGNDTAVRFPRPMLTRENYDFSFSGIKTAVRTHLLHATDGEGQMLFADDTFWPIPTTASWEQQRNDIVASFQRAVVETLVTKTSWAAAQMRVRALAVVGGVACNTALRHSMCQAGSALGLPVFFPSPILCTDNAAMIACAAAYRYQQYPIYYNQGDFLDLDAHPNLKLSDVVLPPTEAVSTGDVSILP